MNQISRTLLGMSLIVLLIPVTSFALTATLDAWLPGDNGADPQTTGPKHPQIAAPPASEPSQSGHAAAPTSEVTEVGNETGKIISVTSPDGMYRSEPERSTTTEEAENRDTSTSTTVGSSPSTASKSTSTSQAPPTSETTVPPSASVGVTITGEACPCQVTGTSELKGTVNLKGDLMVDGGTLIARPGVTVNGNGHQIMFMNGGKANFQGTETFTWSGDGSNANVDRDITFRNMRRIMFHQGAGKSTLRYFSVVDSGTSALGDYPIHFHLNGNSTRGTLVEGVAVVNGKHHAFVPHGSHGITFKDTIALNIRGDAYWWDDPGTNESCSFQKYCTLDNTNDVVIEHALAAKITNGPGDNRGYRLAGFHLGAGSGNMVVNSAAVDISPTHVTDCSGFSWSEGANQNVGGNVWSFRSNYSASSSGCHGIFVWQNDSNNHVIDGFTGGGIDHGAYVNSYHYRNVDVPYLEFHATGWSMANSHVGDVTAMNHATAGTVTFKGVTFDSFTIKNGAKEPAIYVIDDSNMTCDQVRWQSVSTGTKVIIDSVECRQG